ncbi:DUF3459 domain-containing protein [Rhodobacteraceae bacterium CCMM004]|nr:DUF3459 domain-containing protein [Rhodobacteraceae bacterium CCMM004]
MPPSPHPTATASLTDDEIFELRWHRAEADLMAPLARLYGQRMEAGVLRDRVRTLLAEKWAERPRDLRRLDLARDLNPGWFLGQEMVGYVFYVDKFAGTFADVPQHIPWLTDLGVTYVHFMPCLMPRPRPSDGGYAVMDYGRINPDLGTMDDFRAACAALRKAGISPCIDMVLNHTAKEHAWAQKAAEGDPVYQDYYWMFDSDALPRQYEETLLEIFPNQAPGNFTHYPQIGGNGGKWVWTTFNEYQWDLNWENPEVFLAILGIILDLANNGAEVMRLDAVAFMWKRMGTVCQNEPEVHDILQALVQGTRVAAPAVIHKAEAIVGPHQLVPYLGTGRHTGRVSNLAYHNNLMVQFWASLAAHDTRLMTDVLARHFPERFRNAQWATYIRCHDDIGWAITEEDAERHPPMSGPGHRSYLADFYNGSFPGSWARGADFQYNPETGDRRTNGTFASLAGLERALESGDVRQIDLAVNRILMGHALIAAYGGLPLLYMGDEIGLTNDDAYRDDPLRADDGRWMQRPAMDWAHAAEAETADSPHGWILRGTRHLMAVRKATPELAGHVPSQVIDTRHPALFAVRRPGDAATVWAVFNFTDVAQHLPLDRLGIAPGTPLTDLISGHAPAMEGDRLRLSPYGRLWLRPAG